jgi:hypothetical protein
MSNEVQLIWKETVVVSFDVYLGTCVEGLRKTTIDISSDIRCSEGESNRMHTEHKSEALPLELAYSSYNNIKMPCFCFCISTFGCTFVAEMFTVIRVVLSNLIKNTGIHCSPLYCDMMPESRNSPLLDNASVNTISRLPSQQWDLRCLVAGCYVSEQRTKHKL